MMIGEGRYSDFGNIGISAKKKSAIYAEILGYALSCDAHHMTSPSTEGIVNVWRKLLKILVLIKVTWIIYQLMEQDAANDKAECAAMKEVFGKRYKDIPMSSIKSMLGHTMGAASAIEAIACILAIKIA